ncbi:hypothetical protein Tco_1473621, partial [Tanacetum coccineum]
DNNHGSRAAALFNNLEEGGSRDIIDDDHENDKSLNSLQDRVVFLKRDERRFLSDHRPILLRESAHDYGPVPFRFFHHWIHLEGFNDFVTSTWNSAPSVDSNGMRNLAGKLKFLKAHIKIWIKDNKSETVSTIANLKKELNQLDAVIDKGTGTEVEAEKRMEVLAALRNIDHIHSMDLAQKAKIKWSIEGDENSNFFHGILNKKRNQMNIRGITIDGVWKEQPNDEPDFFLFSG